MLRGCWVARPKSWEVDDELWAVIEPLMPLVLADRGYDHDKYRRLVW